jgi:hypothetical protein
MKRILMLSAALAMIGGAALAETPATPSTDPAAPAAASDDGMTIRTDFDRDGPDGKWRKGWRRGDRGDFRGPRHGFMAPTKGARIVLEHRGNRIDVKCADNDSTQQCVDAVKNLMEQVASTMRGRHGPDGRPPRYRDERPDDSEQ